MVLIRGSLQLDENIILNNGVINKDEEIKIGQHTKWTIEMKYSK